MSHSIHPHCNDDFLYELFPNDVVDLIIHYILPCLPEIDLNKRTCIVGVGGGFDLVTCMTWFPWLTCKQRSHFILVNYSFTDDLYMYALQTDPMNQLDPDIWMPKIFTDQKRTRKNESYFIEHDLSKWLGAPIYALRLLPNPYLFLVLQAFTQRHHIEQWIGVDGGVDSVLFGDEKPCGSPAEDSQMMLALYNLCTNDPHLRCWLMASALYVDDVNPDTFLKHWQDDLHSIRHECYELQLDDSLFQRMLDRFSSTSIIQESILAACQGFRGRYKNPRLSQRINSDSDYPLLLDQTTYVWWTSLVDFCKISPFYQKLNNLLFPSFDNLKWDDDSLNVQWIAVNHAIDQAL